MPSHHDHGIWPPKFSLLVLWTLDRLVRSISAVSDYCFGVFEIQISFRWHLELVHLWWPLVRRILAYRRFQFVSYFCNRTSKRRIHLNSEAARILQCSRLILMVTERSIIHFRLTAFNCLLLSHLLLLVSTCFHVSWWVMQFNPVEPTRSQKRLSSSLKKLGRNFSKFLSGYFCRRTASSRRSCFTDLPKSSNTSNHFERSLSWIISKSFWATLWPLSVWGQIVSFLFFFPQINARLRLENHWF